MAAYTTVSQMHVRAIPQAPAQRAGGINRWVFAIAMVLFAIAIVSRKSHLVMDAELFGDEAYWFRDAYSTGAWREIFQPQAGYLCLFSKLPMLLAVHLPLSKVPNLFGGFTVFVEWLVPFYLLTGRLAAAASLPARVVFAVLFVALPNADEVLSLNETQWMLAVLGMLIVVSSPPATRAWKVFDVVFLGLISLTGPFCILLLPLAAVFWYARRFQWTLILTGILAAASCVQLVTMSHALQTCKRSLC